MSGFLKIYKSDEIQDWQREGYFENYQLGLPKCPNSYGLPFFFKESNSLTIKTFTAVPVTLFLKNEKLTGTAVNLTTSYITKKAGILDSFFYYKANYNLALTKGIWEYHIVMSDDTEYYSELFCITYATTPAPPPFAPDFNNDFNPDFLI